VVTNGFFSEIFLNTVNALAECDDNKFVIILGSGFHRNYLSNISDRDESDSLHMLCDWGKLLQPLSHEYQFSGHYLRDFEDIIARSQDGTDYKESSRERELAASEIEKRLLKQIQENLRSAQYTVVSKFSENIPLWLFNSAIVSDVISLNFDLIPEILLNKRKKHQCLLRLKV
jgi:hypothetical protein